MVYTQRNGEIEISDISDFDPVKTFECGQCFRWTADESGVYTGVAFGRAVTVRRGAAPGNCSDGSSIIISCTAEDFETIWRGYFDLDLDYAEVRRGLCVDSFMRKASGYGAGIRILRQDAWEALCSFIISQFNNIPRIKQIITSLCEIFGDTFIFENNKLHTFPSAEKLAACSKDDLAPIHCGYRAAYIIDAAKAISSGSLDLNALSQVSHEIARCVLKQLNGVGNKVADCVLLYGLHMLDSFPLDVWIKRAVTEHYGPGFDPGVFHPYAGVAQQYMYYYMRNAR